MVHETFLKIDKNLFGVKIDFKTKLSVNDYPSMI
jgi:hypothetical protein